MRFGQDFDSVFEIDFFKISALFFLLRGKNDVRCLKFLLRSSNISHWD